MKNIFFCTGLIFILSVFGFGQKQRPATASTAASGSASNKSSLSSNKGVMLGSGTAVSGELQNTLDVRKARVGDPVLLKTTRAIKQNGETIVPKGSSLIGHVTEVSQKTKSNGSSRLGMVFDRVEGKNLSAPISASIMSITNAGGGADLGSTADADVFGSSTTSARASGGSSSGGGGLLGGVTNTAGSVLNNTTNTVGDVTNSVGQTVGNTTGTLGRTVNGIQISNSVSGSVQTGTTLSAAGKDIRLEKGATMQLQLNSAGRVQ